MSALEAELGRVKIVAAGRAAADNNPVLVQPGQRSSVARPPRAPEPEASPGVTFAMARVQPRPIARRDSVDSCGDDGSYAPSDERRRLAGRYAAGGYGAVAGSDGAASSAAPSPAAAAAGGAGRSPARRTSPAARARAAAASASVAARRVNWAGAAASLRSGSSGPSDAVSAASLEDSAFTMTHETATPRVPRKVAYADPGERLAARRNEQVGSSSGSVSRPDFDDCLRRSAAVLHKHVTVCEWRHKRARGSAPETLETGQFRDSAAKLFEESRYVAPRHEYTLFRLPLQWTGVQLHRREVDVAYETPTMVDIYTFLSTLFIRAHLSSECSIVCLIYVERLMEKANVPLLAATWRPILLCAMLLASKVWQDCASWNIEFSVVFPQYVPSPHSSFFAPFLSRRPRS